MLEVIQGNIFDQEVEALVNPANSSLLRGSGLCGLIHKKAGQNLEKHCIAIGKQSITSAVITPSFDLINCQKIIHACGPQWFGGNKNEADHLAKTYENIMFLAKRENITSVAIPAISTGVYRFPINLSAEIAIAALHDFIHDDSIHFKFIIPEQPKFQIYKNKLTNSTT